MKPATLRAMFCSSLALLLFSCLAVSTLTVATERRAVDSDVRTLTAGGSSAAAGKKSTTLFLLTGYKPPLPPLPAGPKVAPKAAEVEDGDDPPVAAELPPKPLPQTMLPRNMTADALKPPLGAAQVAPPPRQLVDVDVCRGYFDVMGQFDTTFNCSKGSYIYCCGTCHYRFCCEHQRSRLDQEACNNYISPVWADPQGPVTVNEDNKPDPDFETLQQQNSSTAYVIGGVISFTLVVAVGVRIAFSKVARRPRNRDINMPRSLVDILRHQSSPVQQGERNNTAVLTTTASDGRTSKNHYTPILQSKDNRTGNMHHHFNQQGSASSPKHSATIERGARMNNTSQLSSGATLLSGGGKGPGGGGGSILGGSMRHNSSHPNFSHSFHNLAQLPPSYESAMKPEINRYSSLKRLEKELDEYSSYYNSKRRSNNAPPSFHSSQHYLPWGGDYTLGSRGTLPLHGSRPRLHIPASTPNPYPLPAQSQYTSSSFDRPPRRVRSQDQLLALGEGNTLSRLSKNQQHQYYKAMMSTSRGSNSQTLRRSHERLLVSPDRLEDRLMMGLMAGGGGGDRAGGSGMVPTMGRLSHQQKTQSQQNICATPSLERHHMIKMNSHPTPGHDRDRDRDRDRGSSAGMPVMGMPGGWDPHGGHGGHGGGGGGAGHPNARRMAFASKRQNTIEQLHFLPGGGGVQGLRTGSKNEVTV
ncbi:protein shisa-7 isoform X1 [Sander lucioperca]|uniref:protein shisa-7 isoform X1 n=1 Tax=Sander lucioperca TaxID=283035 RepID=UPI00125CF665|nr:protein shisa-7 isoform X1 [Sander lucioperca]XP_031150589.1 protein shisa-7 isoform X1 [Sander lucioperca]